MQSRGCPRAPLATSAAASRPETPFSLRSLSLSARRGIGSRNPADARRLQRPELLSSPVAVMYYRVETAHEHDWLLARLCFASFSESTHCLIQSYLQCDLQ